MTDPKTVRTVALGLVAIVLLVLVGAIVLSALDKEVPDLIGNMGTVALGALAALLASTKTQAGPEVGLAQQAGRGQAIEEIDTAAAAPELAAPPAPPAAPAPPAGERPKRAPRTPAAR